MALSRMQAVMIPKKPPKQHKGEYKPKKKKGGR